MDDQLRFAELKLLVALDTLLRERNVTRAAHSLRISQPALSAQLATLRKLFDDQLLVATSHGLVPTPRALGLQQMLRTSITELSGVMKREQAFEPASSQRTFVIAASGFGHHVMVTPLTLAVRAQAPGVKLVFVPFRAGLRMSDLESGDIDLVAAMRHFLPDAVKASVLLSDRHVVVQRSDHPRGSGPLSVQEYCALEQVIVTLEEPHLRTSIDDQLSAMGLQRNVVVSVPTYGAIASLVTHTDMVATLLGRVAESLPGNFAIHPLPLPPTEFLYAAGWHPRHKDDPGHRWLRDTLALAMAREDAPATGMSDAS